MPSLPSTAIAPRLGLAHAVVPLGALAAMAVFAAGQDLPAEAVAEGSYLALLATAVLLAVGGLGASVELWLGAPLVTLTMWSLPAGPARGAVMTALLVTLLIAAAARRLAGAAGRSAAATSTAEAFALFLPLAVGMQFLLRGERMVEPALSLEVVGGLLVLPTAAALALAVVAGRRGLPRALLAGAAAAVLAPGFNVAFTVGLASVAAGSFLGKPRALSSDRRRSTPHGAEPSTLRGWSGWKGWAATVTAITVIAAPVVWEPRTAAVAAIAAAVATGLPAAAWLGGAAALALALAAPVRGWAEAVAVLAWVPILLPALPWSVTNRWFDPDAGESADASGSSAHPSWTMLGAGLILALAAARTIPEPAALAAPMVLLALGLPTRGRFAGPQAVWSAALLAGTALLAGYPWLRREAAADALGLAGLKPGWTAAGLVVVVMGAAVLVAWATARVRTAAGTGALGSGGRAATDHTGPAPARSAMVTSRSCGATPSPDGAEPRSGATVSRASAARRGTLGGSLLTRPATWAGLLLTGAALAALAATPPTRLAARGVVLDRAHPRLHLPLAGERVRAVVVQSNLSNAAGLPAGTRVATVRLFGAGGKLRQSWDLLAGRDTGEWAARRPDVVSRAGFVAPPGWLSWVAVDDERTFFGQRYRARLDAGPPRAASRLEVTIDPALPPRVGFSLFRVETVR